jgi:type IV pilus assembly protein PilA
MARDKASVEPKESLTIRTRVPMVGWVAMRRQHVQGAHMFNRLHRRSRTSDGFTLIELLIVVLILGILAAIAVPSFLQQRNKAQDASAKTQVRAAETAVETYGTDHGGLYAGVSVSELQSLEPTLKDSSIAKLGKAEATEGGYVIESQALPSTDKYKIERTGAGEVKRTCSPKEKGACPASGEW